MVLRSLARAAAVADRRVTGLSPQVLAELVAELGPRWQARQDARLADRPRRRAVGAGARHRLVFIDRLLATLVHLRHGVTHDVLACWFGVSRSTITCRPRASSSAGGRNGLPTWSARKGGPGKSVMSGSFADGGASPQPEPGAGQRASGTRTGMTASRKVGVT